MTYLCLGMEFFWFYIDHFWLSNKTNGVFNNIINSASLCRLSSMGAFEQHCCYGFELKNIVPRAQRGVFGNYIHFVLQALMAHSRSTTSSFLFCKSIAIEISALLLSNCLFVDIMHGFAWYISMHCYCKKYTCPWSWCADLMILLYLYVVFSKLLRSNWFNKYIVKIRCSNIPSPSVMHWHHWSFGHHCYIIPLAVGDKTLVIIEDCTTKCWWSKRQPVLCMMQRGSKDHLHRIV